MPLIPFRQMARTHPPSPSYAVREEGMLRNCRGGGRESNPLERTTYAAQTSGPAPAHPGRRAARPHSKQPRPRPALVTTVTPPPRRALVSEGRDGATTAPMASTATTPDRGLAMYGYDHPASTLIPRPPGVILPDRSHRSGAPERRAAQSAAGVPACTHPPTCPQAPA